MSHLAKFVAALVGLVVMAIFSSRQLFLFAVFKDPQGVLDSQGGRSHLWLAISAGFAACIAGGLMFHSFIRHERNRRLKAPTATVFPGPLTGIVHNSSNSLPTRYPFDSIRWALANPWLSEGQADDRAPMDGSFRANGGASAAQRASTRESHQVMFKKWSQVRHD